MRNGGESGAVRGAFLGAGALGPAEQVDRRPDRRVDLLRERLDVVPQPRILGRQRARIGLADILERESRLGHGKLAVDQHRHLTLRREVAVRRLPLGISGGVDLHGLIGDACLAERDEQFHRVGHGLVIVEGDHVGTPRSPAISSARWPSERLARNSLSVAGRE